MKSTRGFVGSKQDTECKCALAGTHMHSFDKRGKVEAEETQEYRHISWLQLTAVSIARIFSNRHLESRPLRTSGPIQLEGL